MYKTRNLPIGHAPDYASITVVCLEIISNCGTSLLRLWLLNLLWGGEESKSHKTVYPHLGKVRRWWVYIAVVDVPHVVHWNIKYEYDYLWLWNWRPVPPTDLTSDLKDWQWPVCLQPWARDLNGQAVPPTNTLTCDLMVWQGQILEKFLFFYLSNRGIKICINPPIVEQLGPGE
jgi:hypothetical protein